jgi:hypothetical protein
MQGPVIPAEWARRVSADLAASARPEAVGEVLGYTIVAHGVVSCLQDREAAEDEAVAFRSVNAVVAEVRAVDSGEQVRARRKAAKDPAPPLQVLMCDLSGRDRGGL